MRDFYNLDKKYCAKSADYLLILFEIGIHIKPQSKKNYEIAYIFEQHINIPMPCNFIAYIKRKRLGKSNRAIIPKPVRVIYEPR
jgi:hypothetical protein